MQEIAFLIALALAALAYWFGAVVMQRKRRAAEAARVVGGDFIEYLLEALANAATIDGRVEEAERAAIVKAMSEATGAAFGREKVDAALTNARLSKDQLVAYLRERSGAFTAEQKHALLRGVLAVAAADGQFHQREHHVYLEYIEAVGIDGHAAPQTLQTLLEGSVNQRNL